MSKGFEFVRRGGKTVVRIALRGREVLSIPSINQGTAFTAEQRTALGLDGLLPSRVITIDDQVRRIQSQIANEPSDLAKFIYLYSMMDRNETLFYRVLTDNLDDLLPIVYTPTIGKAIEEYSHWYHRPRGVYLDIDHPDRIEDALLAEGKGAEDVDLIVVTDSEGILGIGDQGVGGVAITVGKLSVYIAAAGIHPTRVLPVVLDTGTDNLDLLNDPAYLGVQHARVRGERYDKFIESFVQATQKLFPKAMLHWEDFAASNATRILNHYKDKICTFNDDIQGTAAVVVAAILSAVRKSHTKLSDQRIVVHGAGSAGIGIANQLIDSMVRAGMDEAEARSRFWCLSSRGLLIKGNKMRDFQEPFARSRSQLADWELQEKGQISLADVVHNVKPTILIGTSAQAGCFTEQIITEMSANCQQPIIMPLSNPTSKAEAAPSDILEWSDGRALIATGSPFPPVSYQGTTFDIAQANNALIFPGLGLGVIVSRASRVSDGMLAAAANAVAAAVNDRRPGASLLPSIRQLRSVSGKVAVAVINVAIEEGLAQVEIENPIQAVVDAMWVPEYPDVEVVKRISDR